VRMPATVGCGAVPGGGRIGVYDGGTRRHAEALMRKARDTQLPEREGEEPTHHTSLTGVVTDAMASGVSPLAEDPRIQREEAQSDAEEGPAENPFEDPDGSASPDENDVDEIGRTYGVLEPDGELQLGEDLIVDRDANRWELDLGSKEAEEDEEDVDDVDTDDLDELEKELEEVADEMDEEEA
jgi:hypothetical protein